MSRLAQALAVLGLGGCLSVPAAPECDEAHPCAAGQSCEETRCVESDDAATPVDQDANGEGGRGGGRDADVVTDAAPVPDSSDAPGSDRDAETPATDALSPVEDAASPSVDQAVMDPDAFVAPMDLAIAADVATDAEAPDAEVPPPDALPPDMGQPEGELCNGRDDDADGAADEGFDLLSDANHCGACGVSCALPHMRAVCWGGTCFPTGCERGFLEGNLDPSDGCETPSEVESVRFVRAGEPGGDGNGLGTRERPFATIQAAIDSGGGRDEIVLLPGVYREAVFSNVFPVIIRADEPNTVTIESPDERPAVTLNQFWNRLEGVTLRAPRARIGLDVKGAASEVQDVRIEDVHTEPAVGADGPVTGVRILGRVTRVLNLQVARVVGGGQPGELDAHGVLLEREVDDTTLLGLSVDDVRGGDASPRGLAVVGGAAYGLRATGTADLALVGSRIASITGGAGSGAEGLSLGPGGPGGASTGLSLTPAPEHGDDGRVDGLFVNALTVEGVTGGPGGPSNESIGGEASPGADGGTAVAIALSGADNARVSRLNAARIGGGAASAGSFDAVLGAPRESGLIGASLGVMLAQTQRFVCTDSFIEGLAAEGVLPDGRPPRRYGFEIDALSRGAAIDPSVRVHGDPVLYVDGGRDVRLEGFDLVAAVPATNWGRVALRSAVGVTLRDVRISNVPEPAQTVPGDVVGIFVGPEATGVVIEDCTFGPLEVSEAGASIAAIQAASSPGDLLTVQGNRFVDLCGECRVVGESGVVLGVDARRDLNAKNNLFARLTGHQVAGHRLSSDVRQAAISLETYVDLVGRLGASGVLVLESELPTIVTMRNSVFDRVELPLDVEAPGIDSTYTLDHALVWQARDTARNATVGENLVFEDPLLDPDDGYRPRPGSPAIDAGDPRAQCALEPPGDPDGMCRVDLGYTGNTPAASFVGGR